MPFKVTRYEVYQELRRDADQRLSVWKDLLDEDGFEFEEERFSKEIDKLLESFFYVQDGVNWSHVDLENPEHSFEDFCVGAESNLIADFYFSEAELKSKLLDWYLIDTSIAYVFNRLNKEFTRVAMPRVHTLMTVSRSKMYALTAWYAVSFILKWLLLIGLIAGTFVMGLEHLPWLLAPVSTVLWLIYRRRKRARLLEPLVKAYTDKLMMVKRVYALTGTPNIDWDVLRSELADTRKQGIEWPSALYSAIRSRSERQVGVVAHA